jgi:hypothetical protein
MKDFSLIHYYYGDRYISFKTGLGSAVRAKGYSASVNIVVLDSSFSWLENRDVFANFDTIFLDLENRTLTRMLLKEKIESLVDNLLLISNFDLLIEKDILTIEEFIELIRKKQATTEIILTGETYFAELKEEADYVSHVKSVEN